MSLFASFSGLPCPECGLPIMFSRIYYDKDEPELGVMTREYCQTELQVSKDPMTLDTWEIRAERVKRS